MNERMVCIKTLIIGAMLVASTVGFPYEVYNAVHTSSIFSISVVCILAGFSSIFCLCCRQVKITWVDLFILFCLFNYIGNMSNVNMLWNVGGLCLLILFIIVRVSGKLKCHFIYFSSLAALSILSVWGYLQYLELVKSCNSLFSITGPYHNPGILGGIMWLFLGIVICSGIQVLPIVYKRKKLFYVVCSVILFSLPVFVLTYARAAWVALIVAVAYVCFTYYIRILMRKKTISLLCFLCGIVLLLCYFYCLKPSSADGRLLIWKVSCQMIKDRPLTGFGKGGFEANYLYYQAEYMQSQASEREKYVAGNIHFAFNEFIRLTVEYGIVGFVIFTLFIVLILYIPTRKNVVANTAKAIILGIIVWGMFSYPDHIFPIMAILVLSSAILLKQYSRIAIKNYRKIAVSVKVFRYIMLLLSLFAFTLICKFYKLYNEVYIYQKTVPLEETMNDPDKLKYFHEQLPMDIGISVFYIYILQKCNYVKEFKELVYCLEEKYPTPSLFIQKGEFLQLTNQFAEAEKAYKMAAAMVPTKQKARYKLVLLYDQTGRKEEAIALARALLGENVKNYSFETFEMHQNLKKKFREIISK